MRLSLKYKIVLKGIPSSRTRVGPEWVEELWQEKAIGLWNVKVDVQTELQQRI